MQGCTQFYFRPKHDQRQRRYLCELCEHTKVRYLLQFAHLDIPITVTAFLAHVCPVHEERTVLLHKVDADPVPMEEEDQQQQVQDQHLLRIVLVSHFSLNN